MQLSEPSATTLAHFEIDMVKLMNVSKVERNFNLISLSMCDYLPTIIIIFKIWKFEEV